MRARNIKPAFFSNEVLGVLDPIIQLTFAGLWCLADRDGILENRPLRIKAELFPYREGLDVNGYLTVLERLGFIACYEVDGNQYIEVLNFRKHQSPHHTEKAKGFPANPLKSKVHRYATDTSPAKEREHQVPTRSDSLIPDSLIPDSSTHKPQKQSKPKKRPIPADFGISDAVREWATKKGHTRLEERLDHFIDAAKARGYEYADWDAAFRNAITNDWMGGNKQTTQGDTHGNHSSRGGKPSLIDRVAAADRAAQSAEAIGHGQILDPDDPDLRLQLDKPVR